MSDVWESVYLDAYDKVMMNSDIYLQVQSTHLKAMAPCRRVLDSGCGTGNVTFELLRRGKVVYAADLSRKAPGILKEKCSSLSEGLHIIRLRADSLPFKNGCFDGISSMFAAHFVDEFSHFLKEHYRVLEQGGIFMLTWRVSGEGMEMVARSYEESLKKRGLLQPFENEMDVVRRSILEKVGPSVRHHYPPDRLEESLKDIGFRSVETMENPYFGQCHSFLARK